MIQRFPLELFQLNLNQVNRIVLPVIHQVFTH